jgi:hypothetical protein
MAIRQVRKADRVSHTSRTAYAAVTMVILGLFVVPLRPPHNDTRNVPLSPQYGKAQRILIGPKGGFKRGAFLSYLPRSVSIETNGPGVRVYLMHLAAVKEADRIAAFMKATEEAERGLIPTTAPLLSTIDSTTQERINLHRWPARGWPARGWDARYLLIIYSDSETEATVRVSYDGR